LGNPDKEKRDKGMVLFLDDLKRCDMLGINQFTFHPGSHLGECSVDDSIKYISESINIALGKTERVSILIENMAGQGNVIGSKFEELAKIIALVENKERIGVCLDTCHMFAAGYDIRTKDVFTKTFQKFDEVVGFQYLKGVHLNDSKVELGSNVDRHENLGKGKIGMECFKLLMNDKRFYNIPIILETPDESQYLSEIEMLYSFLEKK